MFIFNLFLIRCFNLFDAYLIFLDASPFSGPGRGLGLGVLWPYWEFPKIKGPSIVCIYVYIALVAQYMM